MADGGGGGTATGTGGGTTSSFFSPAIIISSVAAIGIIAVTVYFYRSNQDLLNKFTEQQKVIAELSSQLAKVTGALNKLIQDSTEMREAMKIGAKKRKGMEKRINNLTEDLYTLTEELANGESTQQDGKKKKKTASRDNKKTVSRDRKPPARRSVRIQEEDDDEDGTGKSDDDDEDDDEAAFAKEVRNKKGQSESLI
jgi:hypothetical protein